MHNNFLCVKFQIERHRTGGGVYDSKLDDVDDTIIAMSGQQFAPHDNPFDGDTGHHDTVTQLEEQVRAAI